MYRPLPKSLTIKKSPIEGLGLYATENIKANCFVGLTHIQDNDFENGYIRTPLGGFYNHSNEPNVRRVVSDNLPKLKCCDPIDESLDAEKIRINPSNSIARLFINFIKVFIIFDCIIFIESIN